MAETTVFTQRTRKKIINTFSAVLTCPTLQERAKAKAKANDTVEAFANGAHETRHNNAVVNALENHSVMADQALRHEKVFTSVAQLLVEEVYKQ